MKPLYPLQGIVTVLNTPFDIRGDLDLPSLRKHISEALQAGINGFLVPAMASEVWKLNEKERLQMVETTMEMAGNAVPVFAGLGEKNLQKSKRLFKSFSSIGCKNFLFQIPFKNKDQFRKHFFMLTELQPEVIMLQDWDATGYGLDEELILELFDTVEAFRCLKIEVVPAGIKYSRMLRLTNGRLNVSGGWAVNQMIEGLQRGVHAFMPTGMHYIYTKIYQDYIAGNIEAATKCFNDMLPVIAFSNQHLDISIHFFKRLLYRQGIYATDSLRSPALPFDNIHKELADQHIQRVMAIEEKIKTQRNKPQLTTLT